MNDSKFSKFYARNSGRTTRMLNEVLEIVQQKQKVCVLTHDESTAHHLDRCFQKLCHDRRLTVAKNMVEFKTPDRVREVIDWQKKELICSDRKLVVDHHVYAKYFGFAIDGFHHYDDQVIVNPKSLRWLG